jgi:hypothetical protein
MLLAFRLPILSRLFRPAGADWGVAIVSAAGTIALLGAAAVRRSSSFHLSPTDLILVGLALCSGACGFYGVRSWRRLWRAGRTPTERFIYDLGVRGYGAFMLLLSPVLVGIVMWPLTDPMHSPGGLLLIISCVFVAFMIGFPLWLWAGYACGLIMSGVLPYQEARPHPATDSSDLPPAA